MCADQPPVRAHAKSAGVIAAGMRAISSTTAPQNSTFVSSGRSGCLLAQRGDRRLLERLGDLDARRAELLRRAPQDPRARILGAVDAVAEAHDPLAAREQLLDVRLGIARLRDGVEHRQHARRRAAVQRAGERADRGRRGTPRSPRRSTLRSAR